MQLFSHQQEFLTANPNKALCAFEAGTGKTLTAVEWLRSRQGNAIVVVPKRIVKKWRDALGDVKATVITKEEWKKVHVGGATALVIDEAQFHSSPLFTRGRSQLATKTYNFIKQNPNCPVLLLTATPISSTPANLHTLLCYIGVYIPWPQWRNEFYTLTMLPFLTRPAWMPKKDWRINIRPYLLKYAHIALMSDCVEYLPPITEEIVSVAYKPLKDNPEVEPMARFVSEHRYEQKGKENTIRDIGQQYRKVMVIAHFREQISELEKSLSKDKKTYVLHGGVKDQEEVIREAQADDECYFICQSSIGVGFDADTFSVMIFVSQSYSYVSFVQMKARIRRIHALKPVKYIYLQAGRCDREIYKQLQLGKDFDVTEFTKTK